MDVIQARRRLMMLPHGIDTSPKIYQYNAGINVSNPQGTTPLEGCCVTELYNYQLFASGANRTLVTTGAWGNNQGIMTVWKDGVYRDFWGTNSADNFERAVIMPNTNGLKISLNMSRLNDAYALIKETGEILFAGKNSIYYGHLNTSELN